MVIVLQEIMPPSTKLKSPMPEAENTSWAQSNVMATKPAVEIKEDKVPDSNINIQEDKKVGTSTCFTLHCVICVTMCEYCDLIGCMVSAQIS